MIGTIYRIYIVQTGESYVGRTTQEPDFVWGQAKSKLKHGKHTCKPLQEAVNKHGLAAAKFEILEQIGEGDGALAEVQSKWMKKFVTFNKKVTMKPRKPRAGRAVIWNDITYPTLAAAARATGKKAATLWKLIQDGYESDDDYTPAPFAPTRLETEWEGNKYLSIRLAAEAAGIRYHLMRKYRQLGITTAAAAEDYHALENEKKRALLDEKKADYLEKQARRQEENLERLRQSIDRLRKKPDDETDTP